MADSVLSAYIGWVYSVGSNPGKYMEFYPSVLPGLGSVIGSGIVTSSVGAFLGFCYVVNQYFIYKADGTDMPTGTNLHLNFNVSSLVQY